MIKNAIYNWTYADEQKAKREFQAVPGEENPYGKLPQLNMFTYQMSEIIKEELSQGIEINGETAEYAFDLNEFFSTNASGKFVYDESVDKFLDAMTEQEKFPFSTPELRDELKHTLWLLNRVDSAKALAKKLHEHPVFKNYEIVLAAGDGKLDENQEADDKDIKKAYDKVTNAIKKYDKIINLVRWPADDWCYDSEMDCCAHAVEFEKSGIVYAGCISRTESMSVFQWNGTVP